MPATATCLLIFLIVALGGIAVARIWRWHSDKQLVRGRLESLFALEPEASTLPVVAEYGAPDWYMELESRSHWLRSLRVLLDRADFQYSPLSLLSATVLATAGTLSVCWLLSVPFLVDLIAAAVLLLAPYVALSFIAEKRRSQFVDQLPDALDLMISVLRSGLSIPQAIKSVAEEMPSPCGAEFSQVLHRINLGQSLTEALQTTSERYCLFELDLLRRATSIQAEVGGSLAELLEKTNNTLRQRLRLKRHIRIFTAQSRLSGTIIALLPFVIAAGFQLLNPGYLTPLFQTNIGRVLLLLALGLQAVGILTIRRMSACRV